MSNDKAATSLTALAHSNKLGKDNQEFCMSMWAAWRLKALCEGQKAAAPQTQK